MAQIVPYNTIVLKGTYGEGGAQNIEGPLGAAAMPGMNMVMSGISATQKRDTWLPGATNQVGTGTSDVPSKAVVRVLKEDALQGKTVEDAYAQGDNGFIHAALPGEHLQVLVAAGQTVIKGQALSAIASGKWNVDVLQGSVEALEQSSGALAVDTLIPVRVL